MKRLALAALTFAAVAATPLPSIAGSNLSLYIGTAPPAPMYEPLPPPRAGYVWAPGHWAWNGHRHAWAPGYWVVSRPGYAYQAPAWHARNGGWMLEPARWTPYRADRDRDGIPDRYEGRGGYYHPQPVYRDGRPGYGHGYRDRDRDGVPDRYEGRRGWDQDRDGVPNRYDRDRDGDGVPNRYDHRPDNGWRR